MNVAAALERLAHVDLAVGRGGRAGSRESRACDTTMMRWAPAVALVGLLASCTRSTTPSPSPEATAPDERAIELVESVPIETTLDAPDIPNAAQVWPRMIARATRTIELAQFYASSSPGSALEPVIEAIEAAVTRGVRVRFLGDASFVKVYPETLDRLRRAGAEVRALDLSALDGILHAKYFVIDRREAYVGSHNFDYRALEHNLELGVRVHDAGVLARLGAIFEADWARAGGEPAPASASAGAALPPSNPELELLASPKQLLPAGVEWDLPRLVSMIETAKSRIRILLLTYKAGEWTELDAPLRAAAKRGVAVELAVSSWATRDKTLPGLVELVRAGAYVRIVSFPEHSGGFIPFARVAHVKLVIADGTRAWLGTSNFDHEYFYKSRNLGLVIGDQAIVDRLTRYSDALWTSRYTATLDPTKQYTPPRIE